MNRINIFVAFTLLLSLFFFKGYSQQASYILPTNPPTTIQPQYIARDYIQFKPGFQFIGTTSNSFNARIDEFLSLPTNYSGTQLTEGSTDLDINTSLPVATIAGSASVGSSGAANYSIPIGVPPGTSGMVPNLSIVYNSQGGNGLLGLGWDLAGLSSISRIPQTYLININSTSVDFTANDRFALDGNRLVIKNANDPLSYGANGLEYRTENNNFSKIVSYGVSGSGPSYFIVTSIDGTVIEYGNTTDSRFIPQSATSVLVWKINKITDRFGNYMLFNYKTVNGENVIDNIQYTGNQAASLAPYNKVQFYYDTKTEEDLAYIGGKKLSQKLILKRIKVYAENQQIRDEYSFDYFYDNFLNKTKLQKVNQKVKNQTEINSTKVIWEGNGSYLEVDKRDVSFLPYNQYNSPTKATIGDYNGDGISDFIILNSGLIPSYSLHIGSANETAQFSKIGNSVDIPTITDYNFIGFTAIDIDNDGIDEIIFKYSSVAESQSKFKYYKLGTTSLTEITGLGPDSYDYNAFFDNRQNTYADINGDGRKDVVLLSESNESNVTRQFVKKIFLSNENGTFSSIDFPYNIYGIRYTRISLLDINGNGKTDIMITDPDISIIYEYQNGNFTSIYNGGFPKYDPRTTITTNADFYVGDFNGDQKSDIISKTYYNPVWNINYSSGSGFDTYNAVPVNNVNSSYTANQRYYILDVNGDGKDDIVESNPTDFNTTIDIYYSNSNSFRKVTQSVAATTTNGATKDLQFGDFNGDGKKDILGFSTTSIINLTLNKNNHYILSIQSQYKSNYVKSIYDGFENSYKFSYKTLCDNSIINGVAFYSKGASASNPIIKIRAPYYCVQALTFTENLTGNVSSNEFCYNGLKYHMNKKQLLGFDMITKISKSNNIITGKEVTYYTIIGELFNSVVDKTIKYSYNNAYTAMSEVQNEYFTEKKYGGNATDYDRNYFQNLTKKTIVKDYYNLIKKVSGYLDANSIDDLSFGDASKTDRITDLTYNALDDTHYRYAVTKEVSYKTAPSYAPWYASQVEYETVTQNFYNLAAPPPDVRNKKCIYDANDRLFKEIMDYDNLDFDVKTEYSSYNSFGVPLVVKTLPPTNNSIYNLPIITNTIVFDSKGRFITEKKNTMNHVTMMEYEPMFGNLIKTTDPNLLVTSYEYDNLGREFKTNYPDGTFKSTTVSWAMGGTYPSNSLFKTVASSSGNPNVTTLFDGLSRSIRSETLNFNSETIYSETVYNAKGEVEKVSLPYIYANQQKYTTYTYDYLGRKTNETAPNGSLTDIVYEPRKTTMTISGVGITSQTKTVEVNCLGQNYYVQDNNSKKVYYSYNNARQLQETWVDDIPQHVMMDYNVQGMQTLINDPDAGISTRVYDAYGQEREFKNGKQNALNLNPTTTSYNNLGQVVTITQPDGSITTYDYYTAAPKIGKLKSVAGWNGITDSYDYDALGRESQVKEEVTENGTTKTFTKNIEYDDYGRAYKVTYPYTGGNLVLEHTFQNGVLKNVNQLVNNVATTIWQANHQDLLGNYDNYNSGNVSLGMVTLKYYDENTGELKLIRTGTSPNYVQDLRYTYDKIGNMINRKELFSRTSSQEESFTYDNLNRLSTMTYIYNQSTPTVKTMAYDNVGNITTMPEIGTYSYGLNAGPHAITGITNNPGTFIEPQDITYTSFDKVLNISQTTGSVNKEMDFTYGPDYSRRKTVYKENGTVLKTKYFALGDYEETINAATGIVNRDYYISGGDGLAAIYRLVGTAATSGTMYYIHKDHLGSFDKITDNTGAVVDSYSFDAWGNRVGNIWNTPDNVTHLFDRGYTGHEHLDQFGLINMNGRIYDPKIGRFLSPDPYIQAPDNTQNHNRYSYCLNNPLIYTDPSGEFIFTAATLIAAPFTGGASLAYLPAAIGADLGMWQGGSMANGTSNPFKWDYSSGKTWGYMAGGAITGGVSGYLGGAVASSGMPFANTAGIVSSSFVNSVGTSIYTGGQTDVSVSFGFGSYNFDNNSWDGIWNWNSNSSLENMGYTFGALANLSDMGKIGDMYYNVEKNDMINHAAIKDINKDPIISFGPGDSPKYNFFDEKSGGISGSQHYGKLSLGIRGTNDYDIVGRDILLKGVNTTMIKGYGKMLSYLSNEGLVPYSFLYSSCSTHVGIGLWLSGVPNLLIHPYTIQASVWLWNQGITPALIQNSYHLIR